MQRAASRASALDLAVIGNCRTAALLDTAGRIPWWCFPRFDSDPVFSTRVAERFSELIPGALPAETVANAGHFLQEDAGEEIAGRIVEFLGKP